MNDVWIGTCILTKIEGADAFWGDFAERVSVRMIMLAPDAIAFQHAIHNSVNAGGAIVVAMKDVAVLYPASDDPASRAAIKHANASYPILVEQPIAMADVEPENRSLWHEANWTSVLGNAGHLWAVVDGVSWPEITSMIEADTTVEACCLYTTVDQQTRLLAPWLIRLEPGASLTEDVIKHDQHRHALILFRSSETMDVLRAHLRRFTMLQTPEAPDAPVYFRFYDGRVMLDIISTMSDRFCEKFFDPISQIVVPLSPHCLVPENTQLVGKSVLWFEPSESCQGRLLTMDVEAYKHIGQGKVHRVTDIEADALSRRFLERTERALARNLYEAFSVLFSPDQCVAAANGVHAVAAEFGLVSVKQVNIFARCQLFFGTNFAQQDSEARCILEDPSTLPWQKKNELVRWFSQRQTAPETLRNLEKTA